MERRARLPAKRGDATTLQREPLGITDHLRGTAFLSEPCSDTISELEEAGANENSIGGISRIVENSSGGHVNLEHLNAYWKVPNYTPRRLLQDVQTTRISTLLSAGGERILQS